MRHQHIGGGNCLAVLVHAHIECLDLFGVIGNKHRLFEHLLGQVALVLGLQVAAPMDRILELVIVRLEQGNGLGIGHMAEVGRHDVVQALQQALSTNWLKKSIS